MASRFIGLLSCFRLHLYFSSSHFPFTQLHLPLTRETLACRTLRGAGTEENNNNNMHKRDASLEDNGEALNSEHDDKEWTSY